MQYLSYARYIRRIAGGKMTLKNWTVKTERVKGKSGGLVAYRRYLSNANHKNHSKTKIVEFKDNDRFLEFCVANTALKDLQITKGRRIESYAQSFVFSLPSEIQPDVNQWMAIRNYLRAKIKDKLDISEDDCFYSNIHVESDKNSHLNLMVSRCHNNGKLISDLDKFEILGMVKREFTNAVKSFCNICPADYIVKDGNKKNQTRRIWQYKQRAKKKKKLNEVRKSQEQVNANNFFGFNQNPSIKIKRGIADM